MTKPVVRDPLYQVRVQVVGQPGVFLPVGPAMVKEAVEGICEAFNRKVLDGTKRQPGDWFNAHPVLQAA